MPIIDNPVGMRVDLWTPGARTCSEQRVTAKRCHVYCNREESDQELDKSGHTPTACAHSTHQWTPYFKGWFYDIWLYLCFWKGAAKSPACLPVRATSQVTQHLWASVSFSGIKIEAEGLSYGAWANSCSTISLTSAVLTYRVTKLFPTPSKPWQE